jgi:type III pantothenate kinase
VILAIDCGNSWLKWGLHDGRTWARQGSLPLHDLDRAGIDWAEMPRPSAIVVANVAGDAAREALEKVLRRFDRAPIWVSAQASQCGVINGYANPSQLGADRWAALIGARHLYPGPSLVVMAGTATTVDLLSASGLFRGGLILPGIDLMKRSLAEHAAQLPLARGEFAEEPRNTADAIETGCLLAQAGAIKSMFSRSEHGSVCVCSGGYALRVAGRLDVPLRVVDNLVLLGLVRIAST